MNEEQWTKTKLLLRAKATIVDRRENGGTWSIVRIANKVKTTIEEGLPYYRMLEKKKFHRLMEVAKIAGMEDKAVIAEVIVLEHFTESMEDVLDRLIDGLKIEVSA